MVQGDNNFMKSFILWGVAAWIIARTLPIWRGAGHTRHDGVPFIAMLRDSVRDYPQDNFGHPHIPYDEAVRRAREAWEDYCVS